MGEVAKQEGRMLLLLLIILLELLACCSLWYKKTNVSVHSVLID